MQNQILVTSRLFLRKLTLDDFKAVCAIFQDIEVMYAWEHAFTDEEVTAWLMENLRRYEQDVYSYWAVIEKNSGELIGVCGILTETIEDQKCPGVGYLFRKDCWHHGYALESAAACKEYAFSVLGITELCALIRPENTSSRNVAEKLGMQIQREFIRHYQGKEMPHLVYLCRALPAAKKTNHASS